MGTTQNIIGLAVAVCVVCYGMAFHPWPTLIAVLMVICLIAAWIAWEMSEADFKRPSVVDNV